jgi:hypothetical protein
MGATNIHITNHPHKPTSKGASFRPCEALRGTSTQVMNAAEFVEWDGQSAAVCLRVTEPWQNKGSCLLFADAWFGSDPTSCSLVQQGIFSITNTKTQTKFVYQELWADAWGERAVYEHNERANRQLTMKVNGKAITQKTLLGTAGSSREAPVVMRSAVHERKPGAMEGRTEVAYCASSAGQILLRTCLTC